MNGLVVVSQMSTRLCQEQDASPALLIFLTMREGRLSMCHWRIAVCNGIGAMLRILLQTHTGNWHQSWLPFALQIQLVEEAKKNIPLLGDRAGGQKR